MSRTSLLVMSGFRLYVAAPDMPDGSRGGRGGGRLEAGDSGEGESAIDKAGNSILSKPDVESVTKRVSSFENDVVLLSDCLSGMIVSGSEDFPPVNKLVTK